MDLALNHLAASNANTAAIAERALRRFAQLPKAVRNPGNHRCKCGRTISANKMGCADCVLAAFRESEAELAAAANAPIV